MVVHRSPSLRALVFSWLNTRLGVAHWDVKQSQDCDSLSSLADADTENRAVQPGHVGRTVGPSPSDTKRLDYRHGAWSAPKTGQRPSLRKAARCRFLP